MWTTLLTGKIGEEVQVQTWFSWTSILGAFISILTTTKTISKTQLCRTMTRRGSSRGTSALRRLLRSTSTLGWRALLNSFTSGTTTFADLDLCRLHRCDAGSAAGEGTNSCVLPQIDQKLPYCPGQKRFPSLTVGELVPYVFTKDIKPTTHCRPAQQQMSIKLPLLYSAGLGELVVKIAINFIGLGDFAFLNAWKE